MKEFFPTRKQFSSRLYRQYSSYLGLYLNGFCGTFVPKVFNSWKLYAMEKNKQSCIFFKKHQPKSVETNKSKINNQLVFADHQPTVKNVFCLKWSVPVPRSTKEFTVNFFHMFSTSCSRDYLARYLKNIPRGKKCHTSAIYKWPHCSMLSA